eukprot:917711-Amphidinium_carterae.2
MEDDSGDGWLVHGCGQPGASFAVDGLDDSWCARPSKRGRQDGDSNMAEAMRERRQENVQLKEQIQTLACLDALLAARVDGGAQPMATMASQQVVAQGSVGTSQLYGSWWGGSSKVVACCRAGYVVTSPRTLLW